MNVQFQDWVCKTDFNTYLEGNTVSIELYEEETGEPVACATVNVPGLAQDELAIKDYSENEGMLTALMLAELVQPPHRYVQSGFVVIPIVKLTKKAYDYIEEAKLIESKNEVAEDDNSKLP